jgi:hypothetical protein
MARKPTKIRGKYFGKFKTMDEYEEYKAGIIQKYKKTPYDKRNIPDLVEHMRKDGIKIGYETVRQWLKSHEVKIVKNQKNKGERRAIITLVPEDIIEVLDEFKPHILRTEMLNFGINMMLGFDTPNLLVIFFEAGNVLITSTEHKLMALTTNNLASADLKFLQSVLTMAEEQKDWRGYIQRYCKAGGIQYYPL